MVTEHAKKYKAKWNAEWRKKHREEYRKYNREYMRKKRAELKKLKYKLEIEVWGIEVEETEHYVEGHGRGWYKFEYSIRANGGKKKVGEMSGSWSSQTKAEFQRKLRNGWASQLILQQIM